MSKKDKKVTSTSKEMTTVESVVVDLVENVSSAETAPVTEIKPETITPIETAPEKSKVPAKRVRTKTAKKSSAKAPAEEKAASEVKETKPKKTTSSVPKAPIVPEIFFQFSGDELAVNPLIDRVKEAWCAAGHKESSIKSLNLYVKPEENAAYYVINTDETGKIDL